MWTKLMSRRWQPGARGRCRFRICSGETALAKWSIRLDTTGIWLRTSKTWHRWKWNGGRKNGWPTWPACPSQLGKAKIARSERQERHLAALRGAQAQGMTGSGTLFQSPLSPPRRVGKRVCFDLQSDAASSSFLGQQPCSRHVKLAPGQRFAIRQHRTILSGL